MWMSLHYQCPGQWAQVTPAVTHVTVQDSSAANQGAQAVISAAVAQATVPAIRAITSLELPRATVGKGTGAPPGGSGVTEATLGPGTTDQVVSDGQTEAD